MKIPKIRFHPNLPQLLVVILALAVGLEGMVLYQAFYADVETSTPEQIEKPVAVKLDLAEYQKITRWLENNRAYELADYDLTFSTTTASTTVATGRENPFAE
ncbi:MAG: hypothetical protein A2846_00885 [Candidatus Doudnabacteria bacterium RIFCSPHIGHO2_01_FULL_49_9]|uniref:Uncharacterized protein n=1 Tax=Candidatus Doudnabacteria bacterium RIFCSPHIGHO2_01_FULL_49_9 TaxID=1817827 RepID=A0A1F5P3J2_9BACT|nr:MAG: hypothetical protein A2846_00885 [Candidatus Doudnabacteria bacterium RIFCSPHIGHO2_01_FULL_49_9]